MNEKQVFSTSSPRRWKNIKWIIRIVIVILIAPISVFVFTILQPSQPKLPMLFNKYKDYRSQIINDSTNGSKHTTYTRNNKQSGKKIIPQFVKRNPISPNKRIRAGFYVNWDLQSYYSLRNNINELNMVLPEWMFVTDADTVSTNIDARALDVLKKHPNVNVVPMISNYWMNQWRGDNVIRIIHSPEKREVFINSVIRVLKTYNFQGVNIDFESLDKETDNEYLTSFQKELYEKLHAQGYIVTQDVSVDDEDYDMKALSSYNDQLFVMAYDYHNGDSSPGDIAPQKWVEDILDNISQQVDPEKLVLCIAGYGYDWGVKGKMATDISFQEAIGMAQAADAEVSYNDDSYNLHFHYTDQDSIPHTVYFTDAASNFNTIRAADDSGWKGVALWRLGGEDPRLWSFFNKRISDSEEEKANFDISQLKSSLISNNVDYLGEGEILNVLSEPKNGDVEVDFNQKDRMITEEHYKTLPTGFVIQKVGKPRGKKILLSFDDGPDAEWTPQILDILKKENVPATFFMVGENAEKNLPIVKEIYNRGYEIGNHSFSHPNMAEIPAWRDKLEINATGRLIESITGHSTVMFRAPYVADAEPETREEMLPVVIGNHLQYLTVAESIDPEDWQHGISADTIVARTIAQKDLGSIILLHDAGGDRSATVAALPRIIHYFKNNGYEFTTVANLMGKTRNDLMPPLPPKQRISDKIDSGMALAIYWFEKILFDLFYIAIIISILRILLILYFAIKQRNKEKYMFDNNITASPTEVLGVSIIVPAYNESVTVVKTVQSLLQQNYPLFEIILVDDGSKDNTYQIMNKTFADNRQVQIIKKTNGGKASALNCGIAHAQYPFLVCIDADTMLMKNAIEKLMLRFENEHVAAVAGNVKVGNQVNMLTKWQSIEYITSQNFDRLAFAYLNAITVVPGAIGAFRKSAIETIGGFATDTLAEDCDLTMRLLRAGYVVATANDAIAITEAPESYRQFLKQRFRWTFGVMQSFWKNRETFLNGDFKGLGMVAMPNILIFQFLLPLFSPMADLILLCGLFTGGALKLLVFYLLMMLIDFICAIVAFRIEKEPLHKLSHMFAQRLVYRPLMYWILFKSYKRACKGELQLWGSLKRTGSVKQSEDSQNL